MTLCSDGFLRPTALFTISSPLRRAVNAMYETPKRKRPSIALGPCAANLSAVSLLCGNKMESSVPLRPHLQKSLGVTTPIDTVVARSGSTTASVIAWGEGLRGVSARKDVQPYEVTRNGGDCVSECKQLGLCDRSTGQRLRGHVRRSGEDRGPVTLVTESQKLSYKAPQLVSRPADTRLKPSFVRSHEVNTSKALALSTLTTRRLAPKRGGLNGPGRVGVVSGRFRDVLDQYQRRFAIAGTGKCQSSTKAPPMKPKPAGCKAPESDVLGCLRDGWAANRSDAATKTWTIHSSALGQSDG